MQAVEILSLMVAVCIYTGCQGVDLRVIHLTFLRQFESEALDIYTAAMLDKSTRQGNDESFPVFWKALCQEWYGTASLDAHERCERATSTLAAVLSRMPLVSSAFSLAQVHVLQRALCAKMLDSYRLHRDQFFKQPTTAQYLGQGSKRLYLFVRESLGVPMHRGLVEHPSPQDADGNMLDGRSKKTIGSWVSMAHEAVCDGRILDEVMRCVERSGSVKATAAATTNGN